MIEVFYLDKKVKRAEPSALKSLVLQRKRVWVDLTNPSKGEVTVVKDIFSLHPITAEDIIITNTRVKIEEFQNYIFIVLYGVFKKKNIQVREMDFALGKDFLITSHTPSIEGFERLKKEEERRLESLFQGGMDFLMHHLIDVEVDNFIPMLELFDDVIDKIESEIIRKHDPKVMKKILDLKRRLNHIKKIIIPQQEKISFLAKNKYPFISPACQTYFRDVYDHFFRVTDMVEGYRDALVGSFDAYMSSLSNSTNEVMKLLSVMATIMLPLSVISGIYGMNFLVLPGAEHPLGFWGVISIMTVIILTMLSFFKKKGWV